MSFPFEGRIAKVGFTGTRTALFGTMFRGYLFMVATLGVYRFWLTTAKRRFYWGNTEIDGDTLEYTGRASQLLVGFLFALTFFLPLYGFFFYLSVQAPGLTALGYAVAGAVLWFLSGYATYRARDFRLSRTLWRGIRFDQKGSAWGYAWRRFGWSVLMVMTAGLAYPFMAGNLWSYRYRNSWYGDRQFSFAGSWRTVAGLYYAVYAIAAVAGIAIITYGVRSGAALRLNSVVSTDRRLILLVLGWALLVFLLSYFYRAREISRMFSAVSCGAARAQVRVRGRVMFGQFLWFVAALIVGYIAVSLVTFSIGWTAMLSLAARSPKGALEAIAAMPYGRLLAALSVAGGYLAVAALFSMMAELYLGFGFWALVARGAAISDADSLRSVRAGAEDRSVVGEGLADALNVGAY